MTLKWDKTFLDSIKTRTFTQSGRRYLNTHNLKIVCNLNGTKHFLLPMIPYTISVPKRMHEAVTIPYRQETLHRRKHQSFWFFFCFLQSEMVILDTRPRLMLNTYKIFHALVIAYRWISEDILWLYEWIKKTQKCFVH